MWQCRQDSLPGCQGANSRILFLTIGRASQPFPRSKPDVRLSPHPAFQIMTYLLSQSASSRCRVKSPFKSHGACLTFPLMQKPLPVASSLSCQTFTLSRPLQSGFWLLRWLGQPSRTLAFSRLSQTVKRCGFSPVPVPMTYQRPVAAYYTPEEVWHNRLTVQSSRPFPRTFWFRCVNHFHLFIVTMLQTQVSLVNIGRRAGRTTTL